MYIVKNIDNVMWQDAFDKTLFVGTIATLFKTRSKAVYAIKKTIKERKSSGFEDRYSDICSYKIIRLEGQSHE